MKWFNLKAIFKEIGKIRWPKKEDLTVNAVQVIIFIAFFALFFFACQWLVSICLSFM